MIALIFAALLIKAAASSSINFNNDVPKYAISEINKGIDSKINGLLELYQETATSPVIITGAVMGFEPNTKHGFHVHVYGDVRKVCANTGPHFNPYTVNHGGPNDVYRHVGDLGNIEANQVGTARVDIKDTTISLFPGHSSIIGRTFVIHAEADDLGKGGNQESLKTGNSGNCIACGIIVLVDFP